VTIKATLKALESIKDVTPEIAARILYAWNRATREELVDQFECCAQHVRECYNPPSTMSLRRMAIDHLIGTCGVEYLGQSYRTRESVFYCNAGDTYATTILFNGPSMRVGCWGALVEHRAVRTRDSESQECVSRRAYD